MKRSSGLREVSPQFILEGSVYALEQAGLLLHDSVFLYRNEKYTSAASLSLFAIEEIGRSRLLHHMWKEVVTKGIAVSDQTIRLKCENHVFKQTLGQGRPVVYVGKSDKALSRLFEATLVKHATPASIEASAELQSIARRLHRRLPSKRHEWRQKSIYVEPDEAGIAWNRPKALPNKIAFDSLYGANDAYSMELRRLTPTGSIKNEDPAYHLAVKAWKGCPALQGALSMKIIEELWIQINK